MEFSVDQKERPTFTDRLRLIFKDVLGPIARFLNRLGIHPNTLTITGMLGTAVGAYFVSQGDLVLGGALVILMGPIDAMDGAVARLRGEPEDFGAFVDSVSDRYSELFIFAGLLWYYLQEANWLACMLVFAAAAGSVLVSYIRARAQSLGFDTKVGLLTRVERYFVVGPSLLFKAPLIGVVIVAIGANFTALQRIFHVRQGIRKR
ncbi:MAG: CDP-alcohol phosphatidyltransferase family protein [Anaerolineae bacterium]|nr:CDP-alcohol phosphatidyltransferase family protein [Anaerolineae bacterium]